MSNPILGLPKTLLQFPSRKVNPLSTDCESSLTAGVAWLVRMNWELLQTFVGQGNTQQFLQQVAESLQTGNKQFGILQKGLRTQCFQQVSTPQSRVVSQFWGPRSDVELVPVQVPSDFTRNFVCQALLRLINENADSRTPIAHLLLEAVPPSDSPTRTSQAATDLFSVCCCAEHARLAVKVLVDLLWKECLRQHLLSMIDCVLCFRLRKSFHSS